MKNILLLAALLASAILVQGTVNTPSQARHIPELGAGTGNNPTMVILWATPSGWNADWSPNLNPTFVEFRGVKFGVNASWNGLPPEGQPMT